jgi:YegS/Rv2252/BmrU family lipid kinase
VNKGVSSDTERSDSLDCEQELPSCSVLIVNPASGGYNKERVAAAMAALEPSGLNVELLITTSARHTESAARQICTEHERPLIIVGGGDGTINGVINGLSSHATLALLPFGTSNVLAAELNIQTIDDAVAKIIRHKTSPLSVGLLDDGVNRRYFILMAGIGVDGSVVKRVGVTTKRFLGKGAYLLSALQQIFSWEREKCAICVDGAEKECHSIVICNAAHYGGAFQLAREADISSPVLEAICIVSDRRRTYIELAVNVLTGKAIDTEEVVRLTGQVFMISGRKDIQVDGDFFGHSPVTIKTVRDFARVIV